MRITNWTILAGFVLSGFVFFSAMGIASVIGESHWLRENVIPFMVGFGVLVGWLCTVAGLFNVVFGIAFRISGRLGSFWRRLYPVTFGLSVLAMLIVSGRFGF